MFSLNKSYASEQDILKNQLLSLSKEQLNVLLFTYQNAKKYGVGYLLSAIAWEESVFGKAAINFTDPSAGYYHNLAPTVLKRLKMKDTPFNRNLIGTKLIYDRTFSFRMAMEELMFWKRERKDDLEAVIRSYNAGYSWEKYPASYEKSGVYYKRVSSKMEALRWFFENYDLETN
jgi:soluble lytic murein transglycosylase-like protein